MKHSWLTLDSVPYTLDDISVIIPSAAGRYQKRWEWFMPQFLEMSPGVVENTYIPCDPTEVEFLTSLCTGDIKPHIIPTEPRWIVHKTLYALAHITTRITVRLANDISIIRPWEQVIVDQFNAIQNQQIIAKVTHGVAFPEEQEALERDWQFIRDKYAGKNKATACVYPHGSVLMAQTAVWLGYYSQVPRYTKHDHDEIYFSQLAAGDNVKITNMTGIDRFLNHVGITNKDFDQEYIENHVYTEREKQLALDPNPGFK